MDRALEASPLASPRVLTLARALREDLEAEVALCVARRDAELARLRGMTPRPVPTPAPAVAKVERVGVIRWEDAPGWKDGGAFILWVNEKPSYVLRLGTGGNLPHPDFKANADGAPRKIVGAQSGDRVFGLPALDVHAIQPAR
jgi:hypothetical protein